MVRRWFWYRFCSLGMLKKYKVAHTAALAFVNAHFEQELHYSDDLTTDEICLDTFEQLSRKVLDKIDTDRMSAFKKSINSNTEELTDEKFNALLKQINNL